MSTANERSEALSVVVVVDDDDDDASFLRWYAVSTAKVIEVSEERYGSIFRILKGVFLKREARLSSESSVVFGSRHCATSHTVLI